MPPTPGLDMGPSATSTPAPSSASTMVRCKYDNVTYVRDKVYGV